MKRTFFAGLAMAIRARSTKPTALIGAVAVGVVLALTGPASANVALNQISADPFQNTTSQHATELEPDTFANGSTVVSAYQVGRFFNGGGTDIGFARSTDGGATWTSGVIPGLTFTSGLAGTTGANFERVSDPAVAYDAKHDVWMISSIPLEPNLAVPTVFINRSTDGGATWSDPVSMPPPRANKVNLDKNWTVCDNSSGSPFYGHCYTEFDNFGQGDLERAIRWVVSDLLWRAALEAPELFVDARSLAGLDRASRTGGRRLVLLRAALLFAPVATAAIQLGNLAEPVDLFREGVEHRTKLDLGHAGKSPDVLDLRNWRGVASRRCCHLRCTGLPDRLLGGLMRALEDVPLLVARGRHQVTSMAHCLLDELVGHLLGLAEEGDGLWADLTRSAVGLRMQPADLRPETVDLCTLVCALPVRRLHLICQEAEVLAYLVLVKAAPPVAERLIPDGGGRSVVERDRLLLLVLRHSFSPVLMASAPPV